MKTIYLVIGLSETQLITYGEDRSFVVGTYLGESENVAAALKIAEFHCGTYEHGVEIKTVYYKD